MTIELTYRVLHAATPVLRAHGGGTFAVCWVESRTIDQVRAHTRPSPPNPATRAERINALMEQMLRQARLGRPVTPGEAGNLFAFLASDQAKYLTGQIIALDAGALL